MRDARGEGRGDVPAVVWIGLAFGVGLTVLAALGVLGGGLSLPALFVSLSATMMVLAFFALWQSLRGVFGGGPEAFGSTHLGLPERGALVEEKEHLLRAIKDIAFEREVGKISDEDFARLDRAYRQRAKEVLWQLDQDLAPYMDEAQRLVAVELGEEDQGPYRGGETRKRKKRGKKTAGKKRPPGVECARCGTRNDDDADHCKECGARLAPVACPSCGTENDPDAKFCKSCATSLTKPEPEARVGASAGIAAEPTDADSDASAASDLEPDDASDSETDAETGSMTDTDSGEDSDEDRTR